MKAVLKRKIDESPPLFAHLGGMRLTLVENGASDVVDKKYPSILRPDNEASLEREGEAGAHDVGAVKHGDIARSERW